MRFPRSSGVLLHPTSLPGPWGIGDAGPEAFRFVDWLASAGQSLWQLLPLGPTGYGDSPYQCFSAFAGNPLLTSPEALVADGLLEPADLESRPDFPAGHVDYGAVIAWKRGLLARAADRFERGRSHAGRLHGAFDEWRSQASSWLGSYALFMALKDAAGGAPWAEWPAPLRRREAAALGNARAEHGRGVFLHEFMQWTFARQWAALRAHAAARGVAIVGDAPIFAAHDSADVWAEPGLFQLDDDGQPTAVAGVPPDYFSETGQLWGNPLYRWDVMAADGYAWWLARLRSIFTQFDRVRLDHFIGFERCWSIPAGAEDARSGHFEPGPAHALFHALEAALGPLPILAEDLGLLTPEVEELRDAFEFPGMKVLHFAFDSGPDNIFLPHRYVPNTVVYTGTHDNDTTAGWWATAREADRDHARRYLGRDVSEPGWDFLRAGMGSVADTCVVPAQDLLGLGSEARMNFPGRPSGNWTWRLAPGALDGRVAERLGELAVTYGRVAR